MLLSVQLIMRMHADFFSVDMLCIDMKYGVQCGYKSNSNYFLNSFDMFYYHKHTPDVLAE